MELQISECEVSLIQCALGEAPANLLEPGNRLASRRKLNRVRRTESCVAEGNDRGEA